MLEGYIDSMWKKILIFVKNPWFMLSLIVILGIVLRVLEINKTSFWYDEAFTGVTVKLSWKEMFGVIALDKVHPPTFYVLTRLWASVFGFTQGSLRAFSVTWGVGSIVLVFAGIRNLFERNKYPIIGLASSFALAISPFFVTYSIEARSYSFLAFLALGISFAVVKYLDSRENEEKRKYLIWSVGLGILLCITHYLQVVYILAILCAAFIYKYIFTEKGLNKKAWRIVLSGLLVVVLGLIFLPIKEFLNSHEITGMWWIPDVGLFDIIRVYGSYSLGVIRYMEGVPPVRELIFNISPLVLAYILFAIHSLGYIFISISKKFSIEERRHVTFFFFLGIITFLGFYILSVIGFNSFVERYTIAGGIILFVSLWSTIGLILRKWFILIPIGIYVALICMLQPMPSSIDYRNVATELESLHNVQRYIFVYPKDFVDSEFYMTHTNVFYYGNKEMYPGWALLHDANGVMEENIVSGDVLIAPVYDLKKFLEMGYSPSSKIEDDYFILKK